MSNYSAGILAAGKALVRRISAATYVAKTAKCIWSAEPGRFWGIVGRKNLRLGRQDVLELTNGQALKLRQEMRRYRMAAFPAGGLAKEEAFACWPSAVAMRYGGTRRLTGWRTGRGERAFHTK
jgi:hypothetical protein